MPAESRHVLIIALEVKDQESYARYRAEMTPILTRYGGSFAFDFEVSKVLKSETSQRINRVFSIAFPDRDAQERLFRDPEYVIVRSTWFVPAVESTTVLGELDQPVP
jgi:uncharacterized protein (DUF1330 family)